MLNQLDILKKKQILKYSISKNELNNKQNNEISNIKPTFKKNINKKFFINNNNNNDNNNNNNNNNNNKFILNKPIFKCGHSIIINNIINNTFIKIDNNVPSLIESIGTYYIDMTNGFKLKDYNNNIVNDGYYKLKSSITYYNIGNIGWKNDKYYLYYIQDGLPIKLAEEGYYADLYHNILIYVDQNKYINDVKDGYYYYNDPYLLFICNNNIIKLLSDGVYIIVYKDLSDIIYEINDTKTLIYNDYVINIYDNKYYKNQKIIGECNNGDIILTDDNIIIKNNNNWKYIKLNNFI